MINSITYQNILTIYYITIFDGLFFTFFLCSFFIILCHFKNHYKLTIYYIWLVNNIKKENNKKVVQY